MPKVVVKVPLPLTVSFGPPGQQKSERVVTFNEFVNETILPDPSFGKTWDDVLSASAIKQELEEFDEEQVKYIARRVENVDEAGDPPNWEPDERDFDRVHAVAKAPQNGYNPIIAVQLVPYILAIKNARG